MKYFSLLILQSILSVSTDLKIKPSWLSHKRRYFQLLADSLEVHIIFHTHTPSNLSCVWTFHYQQYFTIYPSLLFQVPVFNIKTIDFIQSIKEHSNMCWLRMYTWMSDNLVQVGNLLNYLEALKIGIMSVFTS